MTHSPITLLFSTQLVAGVHSVSSSVRSLALQIAQENHEALAQDEGRYQGKKNEQPMRLKYFAFATEPILTGWQVNEKPKCLLYSMFGHAVISLTTNTIAKRR
jgi:hypothetical protein